MATTKPTYEELEHKLAEMQKIINSNLILKTTTEDEMKTYEWMFKYDENSVKYDYLTPIHKPIYGDLTLLNNCKLIKDSVGEHLLHHIVADYLNLLGTSSAVYEKNGDYAFGNFSSGWCQMLDHASWKLCQTNNLSEALSSGKWLCHESCWTKASKIAIETGKATDIQCEGGINLYAVPIKAGNEIIGAINFGYGTPPQDPEQIKKISEKYNIDSTILDSESKQYENRPPYIIEMAKKRLHTSAIFIGEITQRKLTEIKLQEAKDILNESENKYRTLVETSPDIILLTDLHGKHIIRNKAYYASLGYDENENISLDGIHNVHPEDIEHVKEGMQKLINEGFAIGEYRVKHKNGNWIYRQNIAKIIYNEKDHSRAILNIIRDITTKKQSELELLKTKQMLESVLNRVSDGFIAFDDKYNIIFVNPTGAKLFGQTVENLIGKNYQLDYPEANNTPFANSILKAMKTQQAQFSEDYHQQWDRWILNRVYPSKDGITVFFTDITERIKNEKEIIRSKEKAESLSRELLVKNEEYEAINEELRQINEELLYAKEKTEESELKYKALHNASFGGIAIHDEGTILECNQGLSEISGYEYNELIGMNGLLLVAPKYRDLVIKNISERDQKPYEIYGIRKNGEEFPLRVEARIIPYKGKQVRVTEFRDITQQKNAEKELRQALEKAEESEMRFKALHNASFGGITIHDKGIILECNQGLSEITGFDYKELIGMDGLLLISEKTRKMVLDNILAGYEKPYEAIGIRKNGEEYPIRLEARMIRYKGKQVRVVEFRDITQQKNTEKELRQALEKAEESEKLKTAFLQNMSHEIRTPLNAICGFSEFIKNPDLSNEKRNSFISIIQNSSYQLLAIVSDILTISALETKQEKLSIEKVCINNIIIDLLNIFRQPAINKNLSIFTKIALSDSNSEIYTDKTKLTQILTNLLSNALKFTYKGTIEFGYELVEEHEILIKFFVKDSGIGIKPENHHKIFERFRQADDSIQHNFGGTGLGLSISKGFTEMMGGKIWVESVQDIGSTFYFTIPYKMVRKNEDNKQNIQKTKQILIAEDEDYNFLFIEQLVSSFNVRTLHAKNGVEAIELYKSNPDIALIIMDIKMPIMDGQTAAIKIKELNPKAYIIALTAYALNHEMNKFRTSFEDYFTKPINKVAFKQKIADLLKDEKR